MDYSILMGTGAALLALYAVHTAWTRWRGPRPPRPPLPGAHNQVNADARDELLLQLLRDVALERQAELDRQRRRDQAKRAGESQLERQLATYQRIQRGEG